MSMREQLAIKKREIAAGDGVVDMSEEAIKKQLEQVYNAAIDIHKEYISDSASLEYVSFFNQTKDENYLEEVESLRGQKLYATLKREYVNQTNGDFILPMLTRVLIADVGVLGIVTFSHKSNPKQLYKLFADELQRYTFKP